MVKMRTCFGSDHHFIPPDGKANRPGGPDWSSSLLLWEACGMIAITEIAAALRCGVSREVFMRRVLSGFLGVMLMAAAPAALAQGKPPLKLGGILDMSGLYADITGPG